MYAVDVVVAALAVAASLLHRVGGEPTLDDVLAGTWEGLGAHQVVDCPVCRGEMDPEYAAHARPIGGRCSCWGRPRRGPPRRGVPAAAALSSTASAARRPVPPLCSVTQAEQSRR